MNPVIILKGHTSCVNNIIQLHDGRIASCANDYSIRIWSLNGICEKVLEGHQQPVYRIIQLSNEKIISKCSNELRLWSLDGTCEKIIKDKKNLFCIYLSNGKIASATIGNDIIIWSLDDHEITTLKGYTDKIYCIIQLFDGRIVSVSNNRIISIWSLEKIMQSETFNVSAQFISCKNYIRCIIQLFDGRIAFSSGQNIKIYSFDDGQYKKILKKQSHIIDCILQLTDGRIVYGTRGGVIELVSLSDGHRIKLWEEERQESCPIYRIIQLYDGRIAFSLWGEDIKILNIPIPRPPPNLHISHKTCDVYYRWV